MSMRNCYGPLSDEIKQQGIAPFRRREIVKQDEFSWLDHYEPRTDWQSDPNDESDIVLPDYIEPEERVGVLDRRWAPARVAWLKNIAKSGTMTPEHLAEIKERGTTDLGVRLLKAQLMRYARDEGVVVDFSQLSPRDQLDMYQYVSVLTPNVAKFSIDTENSRQLDILDQLKQELVPDEVRNAEIEWGDTEWEHLVQYCYFAPLLPAPTQNDPKRMKNMKKDAVLTDLIDKADIHNCRINVQQMTRDNQTAIMVFVQTSTKTKSDIVIFSDGIQVAPVDRSEYNESRKKQRHVATQHDVSTRPGDEDAASALVGMSQPPDPDLTESDEEDNHAMYTWVRQIIPESTPSSSVVVVEPDIWQRMPQLIQNPKRTGVTSVLRRMIAIGCRLDVSALPDSEQKLIKRIIVGHKKRANSDVVFGLPELQYDVPFGRRFLTRPNNNRSGDKALTHIEANRQNMQMAAEYLPDSILPGAIVKVSLSDWDRLVHSEGGRTSAQNMVLCLVKRAHRLGCVLDLTDLSYDTQSSVKCITPKYSDRSVMYGFEDLRVPRKRKIHVNTKSLDAMDWLIPLSTPPASTVVISQANWDATTHSYGDYHKYRKSMSSLINRCIQVDCCIDVSGLHQRDILRFKKYMKRWRSPSLMSHVRFEIEETSQQQLIQAFLPDSIPSGKIVIVHTEDWAHLAWGVENMTLFLNRAYELKCILDLCVLSYRRQELIRNHIRDNQPYALDYVMFAEAKQDDNDVPDVPDDDNGNSTSNRPGDASHRTRRERKQIRTQRNRAVDVKDASYYDTPGLIFCHNCGQEPEIDALYITCNKCDTPYCDDNCRDADWYRGNHTKVCKGVHWVDHTPDANVKVKKKQYKTNTAALVLGALLLGSGLK
jgi:hypothetical protein